MSKIYGLEEWKLNEIKPGTDRFAEIKIIIQYPDPLQFIDLKPKERLEQIDKFYSDNLERLIELNLFEKYTVVKNNRRTIGVTAKVNFVNLNRLEEIPWLSLIEVESIEFVAKRKKKAVKRNGYFCVAMTVVVEVEGMSLPRETIEKRFVLIKAKSAEDAYDKIELQKDAYAQPYINPDGRFVRWRIDSLDDCFETDIRSAADLDDPEGIEVYSKLGERKSKPGPIWDGR